MLEMLTMPKSILYVNYFPIFLLTLAACLNPDTLVAKETIQWLWFEQAPYFVGKNPREGIGVGDELTRYFQDSLPEYEHQNIRVNTVRYNSMIKNKNVCVPVAWLTRNERQYLIQTRPHTVEPPAGIYVHQSKQGQFGEPGSILSLKKLLKNNQLKLGALRGMEYSQEVDRLLESYKGSENLLLIDAPMIEISLKLLKLHRFDYVLGLPAQKRMLNNLEIADEYLFYNLQEITTHVPMYAHCSNNPTGKKIIKKLNELLTNQHLITSIEYYESWYEDNKSFRQIFMDYIVNKEAHPLVADM